MMLQDAASGNYKIFLCRYIDKFYLILGNEKLLTEKLQLEEELQLVKGILTSGKNVNQCLYFSIVIIILLLH